MQSNLWTLLKYQQLNQSGFNALKHETDSRKRNRAIGVYVSLAIVVIMFIGYSFAMAYGYGFLGMSYVIPGFALTIVSIVNLFFTFIKTNGVLFAFRDYDMLMALPFPTSTVIMAKFLLMYLNNLLLSLCFMIPMAVGYMIWTRPGAIGFLLWFLLILFAPLLPMSIAAVLGALIAAIGSRFRFKVLVQVILSLIGVLAMFSFSFMMQGNQDTAQLFTKMEDIGKMMQQQIHRWYPVSVWVDGSVNQGKLVPMLLFVLVSVVVFGIFVCLVSLKYKEINTALMSKHAASDYKMTKQESHSMLHALAHKELKRFTSSVPYMMNMGMGMILAVVAALAFAFLGADRVLAMLEIGDVTNMITYLAPFVFSVMLCMTCTPCVSLSLEGKNLWILKSLPVETKTILQGKMLFNLMLVVPAGILCDICLVIALKTDPITAFLYVLVTVASIGFSTVFGMWAGVRFAKYDWENEIEVIKQGMASMLGILGNLLLNVILAGAVAAVSMFIDGRIILTIIIILFAGVDWLLYRKVCHMAEEPGILDK